MYGTLSGLTLPELQKVVTMRRSRPIGACSRAQAHAREELGKMQLTGWPEIALANLNAVARAANKEVDSLGLATLFTACEELVLALMAYGKITKDEFDLLTEPYAHVCLPWVVELKKDTASYQRIKDELEEALTIVPPQSPTVRPKAVAPVKRAPVAKAGKEPKKIGGYDIAKLRAVLAASEAEDAEAKLAEEPEAVTIPVAAEGELEPLSLEEIDVVQAEGPTQPPKSQAPAELAVEFTFG